MSKQSTFLPATVAGRPVVIVGFLSRVETLDYGFRETSALAIVADVETGKIETVCEHSVKLAVGCLPSEQRDTLAALRCRYPPPEPVDFEDEP